MVKSFCSIPILLSPLFANEQQVVSNIQISKAVFIPAIVIGELLYGAEQSTKKEHNKKKIEELALSSIVFDCTFNTARHYAIIKSKLKVKGTPIPENDLWIAALAIEYDVTLATRDRHFDNVDGLRIEKW